MPVFQKMLNIFARYSIVNRLKPIPIYQLESGDCKNMQFVVKWLLQMSENSLFESRAGISQLFDVTTHERKSNKSEKIITKQMATFVIRILTLIFFGLEVEEFDMNNFIETSCLCYYHVFKRKFFVSWRHISSCAITLNGINHFINRKYCW